MLQKDTVNGAKYLDKSLELDPYDGDAWAYRAMISLSQKKWKDADSQAFQGNTSEAYNCSQLCKPCIGPL